MSTLEFAQTELAWQSTQVAGNWMSLLYSAPPLQLRVFGTGMEGTDIGRDYGDPVDGDDCIDRPVLGQCMHGLGVVVDQRLSSYSHFFYNFEPDTEWRFVTDGLYPLPT